MIIRFAPEFLKKFSEYGEFIQNGYARKFLAWVIDTKYRSAVFLQPWIKSLVDAGEDIPSTSGSSDTAVIDALRSLYKSMEYVGDMTKWKMDDKWQTPEETEKSATGDCEDGAIYLYVQLRKAGVPASKLMLFCGYVKDPNNQSKTVGHCWLGYRPEEYPLNWAFIDWCYYYSPEEISERNLFYVKGQEIREYTHDGAPVAKSKYSSLWFAFNEETSFLNFDWRAPLA